jgi:hypothetical protein
MGKQSFTKSFAVRYNRNQDKIQEIENPTISYIPRGAFSIIHQQLRNNIALTKQTITSSQS